MKPGITMTGCPCMAPDITSVAADNVGTVATDVYMNRWILRSIPSLRGDLATVVPAMCLSPSSSVYAGVVSTSISIVIPVRNDAPSLARLLAGLRTLDAPRVHQIVV